MAENGYLYFLSEMKNEVLNMNEDPANAKVFYGVDTPDGGVVLVSIFSFALFLPK